MVSIDKAGDGLTCLHKVCNTAIVIPHDELIGTTIDSTMKKSIKSMLVIMGVKSKQIVSLTLRSGGEQDNGIDFIS